jgi:hypothetical protein
MADPKFCGTYRQIAKTLKISNKAGHPPKRQTRQVGGDGYSDSAEKPTLITIDPWDEVNIQGLLNSGAIVPYSPPVASKKEKTRG